jgi:RHS repeat-associated protein
MVNKYSCNGLEKDFEVKRQGNSYTTEFRQYDARIGRMSATEGHRIAKHVYDNTGTTLEKSTYYILDAQGNQVSMYEHLVTAETAKYNLVENNIFGSSRIGNLNREMDVLNTSISLGGTHVLGRKFYEYTNHLGNVLTVFSDLKIPQDTDNNNLVDNYLVGIVRSVDYSPFGVELDGRTLSYEPPAPPAPTTTEIYKNSFDTPEATTNPYTGATSTLDPNLTTTGWSRPSGTFTNFNGVSGTKAIAFVNASPDTNYVHLNLSVNAGYVLDVISYSFFHRSSPTGYNAYKLVINGIEVGSGSIFVSSGSTLQNTGTVNVSNAISNLSGNVTVTLKLFGGQKGTQGTFRMDDFVLNGFTAAVEEWRPTGYRYGYQGSEKDDEMKGGGNSYTTEFRQYDPRLGRWLSLDPLMAKYPSMSPYVAFNNNPILYTDPTGLEGENPNENKEVEGIEVKDNISWNVDNSNMPTAPQGNYKAINVTDYDYDKIYKNYKKDGQGIINNNSKLKYLAGENSCAIRLSHALNGAGYSVPKSQDTPANVRIQNTDDGNYILDAASMANYLKLIEKPTFSFTNLTTAKSVDEAISKIHAQYDDAVGIIVLVAGNPGIYGATGHADLLYEDFMWDLSMYSSGLWGGNDIGPYIKSRLDVNFSMYIWILGSD